MANTEHDVCLACGAKGSEIPLEAGYCSYVCEDNHKASLAATEADAPASAPPAEGHARGIFSISAKDVLKAASDLADKVTVTADNVAPLSSVIGEAKPSPASSPPAPVKCEGCENDATTEDDSGTPLCQECLEACAEDTEEIEPFSIVEFNVAGSGREALWFDLEVTDAAPGMVSGRIVGSVPNGYPHTAVGCVKIDGETWVVSDATRGEAPGNWRLK